MLELFLLQTTTKAHYHPGTSEYMTKPPTVQNFFLKKNTKFFNLENTKLIHFCDTTATAPRMSWQLSHKQFFPVTESFAIPQNQIKCQLYRVTVRLSDTFLGQYFSSCIIINRGSFFHLYCRIAKAGRRFGKLHKQSYIQGPCRYNF